MAVAETKHCAWRLSPAQARRIAEVLQLQGQRAEEVLGEIECACADYHAAADVELPKSGKERNFERKECARQLRRLEAAAKEFHEALSILDGDAEDELRKEYFSTAGAQIEADQRFNARRLGATAGTVGVAARRAARRLDPSMKGGRPRAEPALRRLIAQLAGIFEQATGWRPAVVRNRDNPDLRIGPFEQFVGLVLPDVDVDPAKSMPTGLIREVCNLWPDLSERCWLVLSRPGMGAEMSIDRLKDANAMYRRGRLSQRDRECRDRIDEVLSSHLDDSCKIEIIREFIAKTLDINEAGRRGLELSRILSAAPVRVELIGHLADK